MKLSPRKFIPIYILPPAVLKHVTVSQTLASIWFIFAKSGRWEKKKSYCKCFLGLLVGLNIFMYLLTKKNFFEHLPHAWYCANWSERHQNTQDGLFLQRVYNLRRRNEYTSNTVLQCTVLCTHREEGINSSIKVKVFVHKTFEWRLEGGGEEDREMGCAIPESSVVKCSDDVRYPWEAWVSW